jgi:similar to stage IV sporulation protein
MAWQRGLIGCLEITLCGEDPERVINMAMSRGIYIWDIRQHEKGCFLLKIRIGGYKALRYLVRRSTCRMRITRKRGLFFYLLRARKRKALVAGLLFFCITLYTMSSFVWFIEVRGNIKVETSVIEQNLKEYGLRVGVPKSGLDNDKIKDRLLLEMPELAWAGIHIQGSKVIIEVAEKTLIPADDETKPADIVARVGGKVEEVLVLTGVPLIKAGDAVEQGQMLIEGLAYPQILIDDAGRISPSGEPEKIRARALVRARIQHIGTGKCFVREEKDIDTGAKTKVILLKFRGKELIISGPQGVPYVHYRAVSHAKKLPLCRICRWPVELITVVYLEQKHEVYEWGLEGAYQEAVARARYSVFEQLPDDYRIISEEHRPVLSGQADLVSVQYELETIEDIAAYRVRP